MKSVKVVWTNKYSKETGYIKDIDTENRHFINTFDETEAKVFVNAGLATSAIKRLVSYGEGENNDFAVVSIS